MKKAKFLSLLPNEIKLLRDDTIINGLKIPKDDPRYDLAMMMSEGMFMSGCEAFAKLVQMQLTGKTSGKEILNMLGANEEEKKEFEKLLKEIEKGGD